MMMMMTTTLFFISDDRANSAIFPIGEMGLRLFSLCVSVSAPGLTVRGPFDLFPLNPSPFFDKRLSGLGCMWVDWAGG
jgi:hypothetical protein